MLLRPGPEAHNEPGEDRRRDYPCQGPYFPRDEAEQLPAMPDSGARRNGPLSPFVTQRIANTEFDICERC